MHPYDNNANPNEPQGQPYPTAPATWPVQGVPPIDQATAPKKRRSRALPLIFGASALVVVLCCGGAAVFGGGDEQPQVKTKAAQPTARASTAPATTAPAEPVAPETTEPEPEPEPTQDTMRLAVGKTATVTDQFGTIKVTVTKARKRTTGCKSYSIDPNNGHYLLVDVKVQVVEGEGSINPLWFTFVDADGQTAEMFGGIFAHCGAALESGNDFPAGSKRSGQVVFDVATTKGEVVFSGPLGDPRASWTVG